MQEDKLKQLHTVPSWIQSLAQIANCAIAAIAISGIGAMFAHSGLAHAAELKVMSTNGARSAVVELARRFESSTVHKVFLEFEVTAVLGKRIESGEEFDVAVLGRTQITALAKSGRLAEKSVAPLGRTGMGLGVKKGGPRPVINSSEALKKMLLESHSVAYAREGGSGREFQSLLNRLGIASEMKSKIKAVGSPTIETVIRGETEFVFSGVGLILASPNVDLVGPLPPELQTYANLSVGVASSSKQSDAAILFIRFLTDPANAPLLMAHGVEAK